MKCINELIDEEYPLTEITHTRKIARGFLLNEKNEVLINGISKWVNVDINTHKLVRMSDLTYGEGEFLKGNGEEQIVPVGDTL